MPDPLIGIRLDDEDAALLEACCTKEKLTKSDVVRRAIRAYAEVIGVTAERKRPKPKRK